MPWKPFETILVPRPAERKGRAVGEECRGWIGVGGTTGGGRARRLFQERRVRELGVRWWGAVVG